jgi:hypothetical protein
MKGVVFNLLEEVVTSHYGPDTWDDLLDASGLDGAYTSLGSYDDEQLEKLVASASAALNLPRAEVLRWFGAEAMAHLARIYPVFFEPHRSTRPFLTSVNSIIHPEVRKLYAGAGCPHFNFSDDGDDLVMEYRSPRRLCALAEGFTQGASAHYGERVVFEHHRCVERGDASCVFHIRWPLKS